MRPCRLRRPQALRSAPFPSVWPDVSLPWRQGPLQADQPRVHEHEKGQQDQPEHDARQMQAPDDPGGGQNGSAAAHTPEERMPVPAVGQQHGSRYGQQAGIDDGYLEEIRQGDKFTVEDAT